MINKTFFKNALSVTSLIVNALCAVICVVFAAVYDKITLVRVAIGAGGLLFIAATMGYNFYKKDLYKRVKVTDDYIQIVSAFRMGFKIEFKDVLSVGKMSMAVTQTAYEKYFISTVKVTDKNKTADKSNTIEFDKTKKTQAIFDYLCQKYGWKPVEF